MVMLDDTLDIKIEKFEKDDSGRFILLKTQIQDANFNLLNVYAPNKINDQINFLERLKTLCLKNDNQENIIIGGDFNITLDPHIDKMGGIIKDGKQIEKIHEIIENLELQDIWRVKNPNTRRYTWRQKSPLIQCRLDYWLIAQELQDYVEKSDIISSVRSDHSAILLHIRSNFSKTRGSNFWKFNNSLLEDNNYIKVIRQNMKHWIMPDIKNKRVQWELIKYYIRKMTIDYCKSKQKVQRDLEKNLNQTLNEIDVKISEKPSIELMEKRNQLCETIKKIENQKIKGAAIRAKDLWYEEGEKSSKYFFSLEK